MIPGVVHLPGPKQVRDLLSGLLGREVGLSTSAPQAPGPGTPVSIATYVDDSLTIRATVACDLAFSARAGAAVALMAPASAEEALASGALDDALTENLYEVLNVAASIFNVPDSPHVRLHALHPAGPPAPPEARARVLALGRREDLAVQISGYGEGRLSMVLC
jgi:hypothetical protein